MTLRLKLILIFGVLISAILILLPFVFPLTGNVGSDGITALGRFHILVLHLPIGLLLIIPVLEVLGSFGSLDYLKKAAQVILMLAILMAAKACFLGYMLATGEGDSGGLLVNHMWGGIITTVLMIGALIVKELHLQSNRNYFNRGYYTVLVGSIISLTIGSHDGASLVHGEDYLYAKLPPSVQKIFTGHDQVPVTLDSPVYVALIKPIFEDNCYLCHFEKKQKGDFRMDNYELLLYGGESGMAGVEPGSLDDSEVHYRITLDPKKKAFMPPEGNDPLTDEQVSLIAWWITNGASPTASIKELTETDYPDRVKSAVEQIMR